MTNALTSSLARRLVGACRASLRAFDQAWRASSSSGSSAPVEVGDAGQKPRPPRLFGTDHRDLERLRYEMLSTFRQFNWRVDRLIATEQRSPEAAAALLKTTAETLSLLYKAPIPDHPVLFPYGVSGSPDRTTSSAAPAPTPAASSGSQTPS